MFDSKKNITARLTDAVDLLIDFATLGEYGLEPVGNVPTCEPATAARPPPATSRQRRPAPPPWSWPPKSRSRDVSTKSTAPSLLRP